jgi:hypothetical protein
VTGIAASCVLLLVGCGNLGTEPGPLFFVPLSIEDESVGPAVVDTGGGYEVMLRDRFGLELNGQLDVLRFGGREIVDITVPFDYSAGGVGANADFALVNLSVCECNGIGVQFFRKTGIVLGLDFASGTSEFGATVPRGGATFTFQPMLSGTTDFDTAFSPIRVEANGESVILNALFDSGTNSTLLRRDLIGEPSGVRGDRSIVYMTHADLGTVIVNARLFDTHGLPDLILGTDVMKAWGRRWYFSYAHEGGTVTVFPYETSGESSQAN